MNALGDCLNALRADDSSQCKAKHVMFPQVGGIGNFHSGHRRRPSGENVHDFLPQKHWQNDQRPTGWRQSESMGIQRENAAQARVNTQTTLRRRVAYIAFRMLERNALRTQNTTTKRESEKNVDLERGNSNQPADKITCRDRILQITVVSTCLECTRTSTSSQRYR